MDFFQITCLKESKNMAVKRNLRVTITFCKKLHIPVITWNKEYLSKQVLSITYTLEKAWESKKFVVYFGLSESS